MVIRFGLCVLFLVFAGKVSAQQRGAENMGALLGSNKYLLGQNIFRGEVGYAFSKISYRDTSSTVINYNRHAAKINFSINPWRNFYFRNTFYIDLNKSDLAPPFLSQYFYQIGNYNWRNKTFSYGYENYQPNRWDGQQGDFITNFKRGFLFLSYNYILQKQSDTTNLKPFFWDETSRIILTPLTRFHVQYQNELNELGGNYKPVIGGIIRYVIIKNIYVETGLYHYPVKKTKLPWDPDYTYGFGISDYRPFKLNVTYGNWIANRFPWNPKEMDYYGFKNGEVVVSFTYAW